MRAEFFIIGCILALEISSVQSLATTKDWTASEVGSTFADRLADSLAEHYSIASPQPQVESSPLPVDLPIKEMTLLEIRKLNLQRKIEAHLHQAGGLRTFCATVAQESATTGISLGITVLANSLKQKLFETFNWTVGGNIACDTILAGLIGSTINQAVGNVRSEFQELGTSSIKMKAASLRVVHRELVQETKSTTDSPEIEHQIKKVDESVLQELSLSQPKIDILMGLIERREFILRSIPTHPKNVAHYDMQGNPANRAVIDDRVNKLIEEYPIEMRDTIESLIQRMRDSSIFKYADRAQAYLYGPAGTGKTRFVKKLAEALGLPLCEISFKDSKEEEILGKNYDAILNLTEKEIFVTGKLGRCFIESGVTNPIIFFDEAGETLSVQGLQKNRLLLSFLKDLLDPERRSILFRAMGVSIDFSRATLLFAGNDQMEDIALRSRLPSIFFNKLGHAEKQAAVHEAKEHFLIELLEVFQEHDVNVIRAEFEKYQEFLIETDLAFNPGGRIIKSVATDTLNYIRSRVIHRLSIDAEQVRKVIRDSVEQRSPIQAF